MLKITIPETEYYDEATDSFVSTKEQTLQLEHSLVSISKWESKWHKPFLSKDERSNEESLDYVRCMTITQNVPDIVYRSLTPKNMEEIRAYLNDSMTATWFNERENKRFSREIVTSEIIYYWMVSLEIPFECEKWHLNRLITLIRVCNLKNEPAKKMSKKEIFAKNRSLNAERKKRMGWQG